MAVPGRLQRIRMALFGRRGGKAAARVADSSESWIVGDMAETVFDGPWHSPMGDLITEPVQGHVEIVRGLRLAPDRAGAFRVWLIFARWPDRCFDARGFRKLTPRADAVTAADAAFVNQLKGRTFPSPPAPSIAARLKRILP